MSIDRIVGGPREVWRTVGSAIADGFCLCEMILDPYGRPADYRFLYVNETFQDMTGLVDAEGRTALDLVPDLERHWVETYGRVALERVPLRFESSSVPMGRTFEAYAAPADPPGRFTIVFRDVTHVKRVEAEREIALQEARQLLVELNHRVKNSLGIISSIIAMEARGRTDGNGRRALRRIEARLHAVAALYRELTRSGTIDRVDAAEYLAGVLAGLTRSIGDQDRVRVDWDIAPLPLTTSKAVPLGLIVNELVTNSLKYAFRPGETGRISVTLAPDGAGHLLRVEDDGRGIDGTVPDDSGLGQRLVEAFVQTMGGAREIVTGSEGTAVTVRFQAG